LTRIGLREDVVCCAQSDGVDRVPRLIGGVVGWGPGTGAV
jgi:phosphosulfolactate phosphohydrolase-like enzyme